MIKWIHKLFNPHCPECIEEQEDEWRKKQCQNCNDLLLIIEKQRNDYNELVKSIMRPPEQLDNRPTHEQFEPIVTYKPWHQQKHALELSDRKKASELKKDEPPKPIETLEEELGITKP